MKKIYTILLSLCFIGMNVVSSDNPTADQQEGLMHHSPDKEMSFQVYLRKQQHKQQQAATDKRERKQRSKQNSSRKKESNVNQTK